VKLNPQVTGTPLELLLNKKGRSRHGTINLDSHPIPLIETPEGLNSGPRSTLAEIRNKGEMIVVNQSGSVQIQANPRQFHRDAQAT